MQSGHCTRCCGPQGGYLETEARLGVFSSSREAQMTAASEPRHGVMPRIMVLVLAVDREPWRTIENDGQRRTWAASTNLNVCVRFYYGSRNSLARIPIRILAAVLKRLGLDRARSRMLRRVGSKFAVYPEGREKGDSIFLTVPETYVTIGAKTFAAFRHVVENYRFDFLFRTNTSSYVSLDNLVKMASRLPTEGLYAGAPFTLKGDWTFVSGAGIMLSSDVVREIIDDEEFDFGRADDVAIARSVARAGVQMIPLPRIDVDTVEGADLISQEELSSVFHYRCKVSHDRSSDVTVMKHLHERMVLAQSGLHQAIPDAEDIR